MLTRLFEANNTIDAKLPWKLSKGTEKSPIFSENKIKVKQHCISKLFSNDGRYKSSKVLLHVFCIYAKRHLVSFTLTQQ